MLKHRTEFVKSILLLFDFTQIFFAWVGAYGLRFHTNIIPITKGVPVIEAYLMLFPVVVIGWGIAFKWLNLYRPRRTTSRLSEIWDITKGCGAMVLLIVAISFFIRQFEYSRLVFIIFGGHSILLLTINRYLFRSGLRYLDQRGYNLHHALIIGAGILGGQIADKLRHHDELGLKVIGFLTRHPEKVGHESSGIKIIGLIDDLPQILMQYHVDQVFIALPHESYPELFKMVAFLQEHTVDVRMVPDIIQFMTLQGQAELFDGIPLITLQATPLYGWNRLAKRAIDVLFSLIILAMTFPLMVLLIAAVRCTSSGPVFYRQKRIGFDGRIFEMLKLRTMRQDAEKETGMVWTIQNDPRRTPLGVFLRKTSLDELPQFINVLKGEMSIVGPRPERPEFVEQFKQYIPKYMLRHKIKAGITGWAQIHGLRGDTSIEERIAYDLKYIEAWSPLFDLKIMFLTLWKGFVNKNAY